MGELQGKDEDQLQKVLESSQTLQPEFMKQKKVAPYHLSKYAKKKQRKVRHAVNVFLVGGCSSEICVFLKEVNPYLSGYL